MTRRSVECDCGEPAFSGSDACATCTAEEVSQGLRKSSAGALGIPYPAGSVEYRREYRKIKAAAGRCSICTGRKAREGVSRTGKPYKTCGVCAGVDSDTKADRAARGVCASCNARVKPGSTICAHHHAIALSRQRRARGVAEQKRSPMTQRVINHADHDLAPLGEGAYAEREED